ncbi:MAG: ferritin-like domain-containing protein [Pseudonocardiaceae bacterium]
MPQSRPSRRRLLAAGATLLLASSATLPGCTASAPVPEGPDPLESPAWRAEADAAQAIAAAQLLADADAGLATAARALAADRMAHATTLRAELRRVRPGPTPPDTSPPVASPPATPPPASPPADPDPTAIRAALSRAIHAAQEEAAALTLSLPGYRAALLASVAACCATHAALRNPVPPNPLLPDMKTYRGPQGAPKPDMSPYRDGRGGAVEALQGALGAEHAAVWVYAAAGAFVSGALAGRIEEAATAHQACRDTTEVMLIGAGAPPVQSEPGYLTPEPVTDAASALRLVITAETDAAAAWRSVVERSPADPDLRSAALEALVASAVRATRWRAAAGTIPMTVPFPGAP